jgi:hypothetical protein
MKGVILSVLHTGPLYPQEIFLVLISVRSSVDRIAVVRSEGLCQLKIPVTSGFESMTFWLVASTNLVTACPLEFIVCVKIATMSLKRGEGNDYIFIRKIYLIDSS